LSITKEIKGKITKGWLLSISELSSYTQSKLYKIVSPVVLAKLYG